MRALILFFLMGICAIAQTVTPVKNPKLTGTLDATGLTAGSLQAARGGTGLTSYTIGDLLYANSTTTLNKLAGVATGNVLLSGGVGTAPSWGKVDLTAHVSGTLPVANGGTGFTAFNHLAHIKNPNTGSHVSVGVGATVKISNLTSEVEDANGLWDGPNSQTTVLPAGWYEYSYTSNADEAMWTLDLYNDGALDVHLGRIQSQQPFWSGLIKADGTSVYSFRVSHGNGVTANLYDNPAWNGMVLRRVK